MPRSIPFESVSPTVTPLPPPPPRPLRLRWRSLLGPNFPYFLHVAIFSLVPLVVLVWIVLAIAWAAEGTDIEGRFTYRLRLNGPGGAPRDDMQVEYLLNNQTHRIEVNLGPSELRQLGMPDMAEVAPGKPLVTAFVPVRVLGFGGDQFAIPLFPWTPVWKRLMLPTILLAISIILMAILHGELYRILLLDFALVRRGNAIPGRLLTTHETGWWESSGEYSWTYIRRVYADYSFIDPQTGRERRGCQMVLGAVDPATLPEGFELTVLVDPEKPRRHVVYEFSPFKSLER